MSDELANFRELPGIGPATEAELHEAGVRTWSSLAAVLGALGHVRGVVGDALRALRQQARDRASEAAMVSDAGPAAAVTAVTAGDATDDAGAPATVDRNTPTADAAGLHHRVLLDAGKVVGGQARAVDLTLSTADAAEPEPFAYDARLAARRYGAPDAGWVPLGRHVGNGQPPDTLPLHFGDVDLSPGLHRLRLDVTLTVGTPARTMPPLTLT
jgi:hypothetical protein